MTVKGFSSFSQNTHRRHDHGHKQGDRPAGFQPADPRLSGFPAGGETTEAFAFPHLVSGWMRGSHNGPLMPVSEAEANPIRFDGPPRVVGLGFQVANGQLIGPVDLFDDPAFDPAREQAANIASYLRRHGPFEPHRLPAEEMEYTSLPGVMEKLESRFEDME